MKKNALCYSGVYTCVCRRNTDGIPVSYLSGCPLSWDRNGSPLILSNLEKETKDDSNKKSIIIAAIIRANYTK